MAKTIMISDEVYEELKKLKGPGESFSDVIKKLLSLRRGRLSDIAGSRTITDEGAKLLEKIRKSMLIIDLERIKELIEEK
ncbi:MAG: antitoxin VapB family protein [archaeon GB-1867-035]|nr:antitoxin VapB family protein [Candidatus Culexmicrobium profundum]